VVENKPVIAPALYSCNSKQATYLEREGCLIENRRLAAGLHQIEGSSSE
jgi:hypothetical protein